MRHKTRTNKRIIPSNIISSNAEEPSERIRVERYNLKQTFARLLLNLVRPTEDFQIHYLLLCRPRIGAKL
jgi:hypothetical protein